MNFKTFEALVKTNTQDSQAKLPTAFIQWKPIIEAGIKRLEDETEEDIRTADSFNTDNDNIPLVDGIVLALVHYVSQIYTSDITLKQKHILEYSDIKHTFIYNKFKEQELKKK